MNLFAYGSLMTPEGLRPALGDRVESLRFRPACLAGWRRIWNAYREEWGGAVLNVERCPDAEVWGVAIEGLEEAELLALDARESTHRRERVWVELAGGDSILVEMYWAPRGTWVGPLSVRYRDLVLMRAREAGEMILENLRVASVDGAGEPFRL